MDVMNIQWEYHVIIAQIDEGILDKLNKLGKDGWECFSIINTQFDNKCYLKRPKVEDKHYTPSSEFPDVFSHITHVEVPSAKEAIDANVEDSARYKEMYNN